jgi:hypothetical protein
MDFANDNMPTGTVRICVSDPLLAFVLLVSCTIWSVLGLTLWRALRG